MDYYLRKQIGDKVEGEVARLYVDYEPQFQIKYDSVSGMNKWNPDYYMMSDWIKLGYGETKAPDFYFKKLDIYADAKNSIKIIKKSNIDHYYKMGQLGNKRTFLMVKQGNIGFCMVDVKELQEEVLNDVLWNPPIDNFINVDGKEMGKINEEYIDVMRDYPQILEMCIPFHELFT
tara:strand:+ start:53 stop:577 length:525 start_codon:yes stop_codon:yes gene_type:complete